MKTSSVLRALSFFALLLLLVPARILRAQPSRQGAITGTLLDAGSHEPIPNTHIVLLRTNDHAVVATATTAANGTFRVPNVPFGHYLVRTTVLGYAQPQPVVVVAAKQATVALGNIVLQPLSTQLALLTPEHLSVGLLR